jgi:hypothetical protein
MNDRSRDDITGRALEDLLRDLGDGLFEVRDAADRELTRRGLDSEAVRSAVRSRLGDPDPEVKFRAARILRQIERERLRRRDAEIAMYRGESIDLGLESIGHDSHAEDFRSQALAFEREAEDAHRAGDLHAALDARRRAAEAWRQAGEEHGQSRQADVDSAEAARDAREALGDDSPEARQARAARAAARRARRNSRQ